MIVSYDEIDELVSEQCSTEDDLFFGLRKQQVRLQTKLGFTTKTRTVYFIRKYGTGWVGSVERHGEYCRVIKEAGDNTWEMS